MCSRLGDCLCFIRSCATTIRRRTRNARAQAQRSDLNEHTNSNVNETRTNSKSRNLYTAHLLPWLVYDTALSIQIHTCSYCVRDFHGSYTLYTPMFRDTRAGVYRAMAGAWQYPASMKRVFVRTAQWLLKNLH